MANKKIKLNFKGTEYVLEYTRETIKQLETLGFSINEYEKKPMTMMDLAFRGAFLANHKYLKSKEINEIFQQIPNKQDVTTAIVEMISECYESLIENKEAEEGNVNWEIV